MDDLQTLDNFLFSFSEYAPKNHSKMVFALFSMVLVVICAVSAIRRVMRQRASQPPRSTE